MIKQAPVIFETSGVMEWREAIAFVRTIGICADEETSFMVKSATWEGWSREAAQEIIPKIRHWRYADQMPEICLWDDELLSVAEEAQADLAGKQTGDILNHVERLQYHIYPHPQRIERPEDLEVWNLDLPCVLVGFMILPVSGDKPGQRGILIGFHFQPRSPEKPDEVTRPWVPRIRFIPLLQVDSEISILHAMPVAMLEFMRQDFVIRQPLAESLPRPERRRIQKRREKLPQYIQHIYLRRISKEQEREENNTADNDGRSISCRYWRKGCFIMQPYGPGSTLRKRLWRRGRVCGPDDKPYKTRIVHVKR